ncbi:coilin-like [Oncorhynchus clarkii lewisi]|uniref:coilin-like n=1 Tax=Oncorhynchus clarkii lewisi TaxID=490388 RepID=UPI0039B95C2A
MAASNTNVIRVRLYFDYPPPSVTDCRMCWVLVDLNKCRVVADIASVIREKFDFSRRSILSLFIEDCYLPHTESVYVVRDNDSIRVKVDTLTLSSGSQSSTSVVKSKKRRRAAEEEEEPTQNRVSEEWKKKKKRKKESQEADSNQAAVEERRKEDKKKQKKKDKVSTKTTASSTGPPPTSSTGPPPTSSTGPSPTSSTGPSPTSSTGPSPTSSTGPSPTSSTGPSPTSFTGPSPTVVKADKNTKKAPAATAVSVNGKATAKTPNGETDDSSDSSESSSEEEEAPSKTPMQKLPPKSHSASSTPPVTSKATPVVKPQVPIKKPRPPPSSSDSDSSDSSGDDASSKATAAKPPVKNQTPLSKPAATPPTTTPTGSGAGPRDKTTPSRPSLPSSGPRTSVSPGQRANAPGPGSTPAVQKAHRRPESPCSSSSSEEEIQLVIKQPGLGMGIVPAMAAQPTWRGRGSPRGVERGGGRGIRGRGDGGQSWGGGGRGVRGEWDRGPRGGGRGGEWDRGPRGGKGGRGEDAGFYFNYEGGQRQQTPQPPSYQKDSLNNSSVVFQNPSESVPKRDYSKMPLLAAPPQDGQKIAFKLLELTENYTPEVSEYKEGKIIHFDHSTKQIELELLSAYQAPVEPGKFDLVYQNADGSESVEYAVSRGSRVTERWDSLLEPRLVVGNLS